MIHTTIGVYSDGSYKVNGVRSEDLQSHIEYNKKFRFGRALVVDGEVVYNGYFSSTDLSKVIQDKKLKDIKVEKCTAPYE